MAARTKARKRAVDILFEAEQRKVEPVALLAERVAEPRTEAAVPQYTVEIVEGPGTVNGNSDRESEAMKPDQTWKWTPMSVKLYGVTAATRIAIRSTQQGNPGVTAGEKGYFRWYLDNVKIVKAPRN